MPKLRHKDISLVDRKAKDPIAIWYAQPFLKFPDDPPFVPTGETAGAALRTLKAILGHPDYLESSCNISVVVLPELAVAHSELGAVQDLLEKARAGTLVVLGVGAMTEDQALSVEDDRELWEGQCAGRYTNCAAIGVGGSRTLYLQPKITPSQWEQDTLWPGKVITCFKAKGLRFAVFICADLLDAPDGSSNLAALHEQLEQESETLPLAIWIQHTPKPRSNKYTSMATTLAKMDSTTFVVAGSRDVNARKRFENFAVSGALIHRSLLPSQFQHFTHTFHYVEPGDGDISRAVLLRYDADAYRVTTVLANVLNAAESIEKGHFFSESQPYALVDGALVASNVHLHIEHLCAPAVEAIQKRSGSLGEAAAAVAKKLLGLTTREFLAFLDRAVVPMQALEGDGCHAAGEQHKGGDARCHCWAHRTCIDTLSQEKSKHMRVFEELMEALATVEVDCQPRFRFDTASRTNVRLTLGGDSVKAIIVHPLEFNEKAWNARLFIKDPAAPPNIICVGEGVGRPKVEDVSAAEAPVTGVVDMSRTPRPHVQYVASEELRALAPGTVSAFLRGRFVAA